MVILEDNCSENLISANHLLRDREPWPPMQGYDNGLDDSFGLVHINGDHNSVIGNHISASPDTALSTPPDVRPVIIHLVAGQGNYIANNHIVATRDAGAEPSADAGSCFTTQVGALLATDRRVALAVTVLVASAATHNTVLDSGADHQVLLDRSLNAFRATPVPGQPV